MASQTIPSPEETVRKHKDLLEKFRREVRADPEKGKEFLLRTGIVVEDESEPEGVKLAPGFGGA